MGRIDGRIEVSGPIVQVTVMATPQRVAAMRLAGIPFPSPADVRSLIDTGASCSVIDPSIASMLGLQPTGRAPVHTPSSGPVLDEMDMFDVSFVLRAPGSAPESFTVSAMGGLLAHQGFVAILGWDVLGSCVLFCDGPAGSYSIEFGHDALNRLTSGSGRP